MQALVLFDTCCCPNNSPVRLSDENMCPLFDPFPNKRRRVHRRAKGALRIPTAPQGGESLLQYKTNGINVVKRSGANVYGGRIQLSPFRRRNHAENVFRLAVITIGPQPHPDRTRTFLKTVPLKEAQLERITFQEPDLDRLVTER